MTAIAHHRKDLRIEAAFLPSDVAELAALRARIVDLIQSGQCDLVAASSADTTADSIVGWLVSKLTGADQLSAPTRSRYRKILSQVAPAGGGGERGSATVRSLLASLGVASIAAAAASGRPVAALVSPIIYEDDVMSARAAA